MDILNEGIFQCRLFYTWNILKNGILERSSAYRIAEIIYYFSKQSANFQLNYLTQLYRLTKVRLLKTTIYFSKRLAIFKLNTYRSTKLNWYFLIPTQRKSETITIFSMVHDSVVFYTICNIITYMFVTYKLYRQCNFLDTEINWMMSLSFPSTVLR